MKKEVIVKLHSNFEQIVQIEDETGMEFWLARDIQEAEAKRAKAKTDSLNNVSVDQKTKQRMADINCVNFGR